MKKFILTAIGICFIVIAIFLHHPIDGFDGWFYVLLGMQDTVYAKGYTDEKFANIKLGMTRNEVEQLIGRTPIFWQHFGKGECEQLTFEFENHRVKDISTEPLDCKKIKYGKIKGHLGKTAAEIEAKLGLPQSEHWRFSYSPSSHNYRLRAVVFENNIVTKKFSEFYED